MIIKIFNIIIICIFLSLATSSTVDDAKPLPRITPNGIIGPDTYAFDYREFQLNDIHIKMVYYNNIEELLLYVKKYKPKILEFNDKNRTLRAFAIYGQAGKEKICTIHIVNPSIKYEPEFLGHEMTHCLFGRFHGDV